MNESIMRSKTPLHLLWLVPLVMAALVFLRSAVAHEEAPCALTLGQTNVKQGSTLGNNLEILSWNIQKASNAGWAEDLTTFAEGVDLAELGRRFGTGPVALIDADRAAFYAGLGFVIFEVTHIAITPQGMPLLDALLAELVPANLCAA